MADAAVWKDMFAKNGWLEGNRVIAPDKRGGLVKLLSNFISFLSGSVIQIDFKDGARYYVKTKYDTIGDHVEWNDNFLIFYKYKDVDAQRPWTDVVNAVLR